MKYGIYGLLVLLFKAQFTASSGWSANAIWTADADFFGLKRLCDVHASSEQLVDGNKRLPDPVSKTTRKGWPPTEISP